MTLPYLDTSALAKWYLNEPRSEDFEAFLAYQKGALISRLTVLEFRCFLARRRAGELPRENEQTAFELLQTDIIDGYLDVQPLTDDHAWRALSLLDRLDDSSLRTLDALHLAIALSARAPILATADKVMAQAATALGFEVAAFW